MRLIDAEALKKAILEHRNDYIEDNFFWTKLFDEIDNAPTVPLPDFKDGYKQAIIDGKTNFQRPQGEWVKIFENPFTNGYVCPFCGHKIQVTEQFLPKVTECESCGARMKGGAE